MSGTASQLSAVCWASASGENISSPLHGEKGHMVSVIDVVEAALAPLLNLPSNQDLTVEVTHGFHEGEYSSSHILGSKQEHTGFYLSFFA